LDLSAESIKEISGSLNDLLADVFALYLKTKNFHWPMSGPHFRDYHLLLDEQGEQIFAITDDIPERVRKVSPTACIPNPLRPSTWIYPVCRGFASVCPPVRLEAFRCERLCIAREVPCSPSGQEGSSGRRIISYPTTGWP
jgi:hypothetical protein